MINVVYLCFRNEAHNIQVFLFVYILGNEGECHSRGGGRGVTGRECPLTGGVTTSSCTATEIHRVVL